MRAGRRFTMVSAGALLLLVVLLALAWASSPDPKGNIASFEEQALSPALAPLDEAITLAQVRRPGGDVATLLVTALDADGIRAVDLSRISASASRDPFQVLASLEATELHAAALREDLRESLNMGELLSAAPGGPRHIGTGTNFPEHAEEASSNAVFQFPKFGTAMPSRARVRAKTGVLLDYEVELCMRFDRSVASLDDFDDAVKGLFLCGDFTDRGRLLRLVDPDNLDSGRGFSDGKSRADFFPSGALLVIPDDWKSFVREERMITRVNGEARQDARGGEMTMDFRALTEKALDDMDNERFLYQGSYYSLAPRPVIAADMTLMSGTAEGVIFTQPSRGDIIEGALRWLLSGRWLQGDSIVAAVIETFIANELASGHFLQPGDVVEHDSSRLGDIVVHVTTD